MPMTINEFSVRTGLAASTLRFYDKKNLLKPSHRLDNGYRVYTDNQISSALIIHSLRQADVSIEDIKLFLDSSEEEKNQLISKWKKEVEAKLTSIQVAKQYLGGIRSRENHVHLMKWEERTTFIWFKHIVQRRIHPFQDVMIADAEQVKMLGVNVRPEIYIRTLESKGNTMVGEIGFILQNETHFTKRDHHEVYTEELEPTLFATMECNVTDQFACFQFIHMLQKFGFVTKGYKLERFESVTDCTFKYLIPLLQHGKN
ncbi:MerR family transcriptional regulator [Bacillus salitolerans]|uniref:MerR family transcriptional regulator n=2 Tax=Bacillus salitolerans TaxID=1437434 RepID=A0ABW4LUS1_9BACI